MAFYKFFRFLGQVWNKFLDDLKKDIQKAQSILIVLAMVIVAIIILILLFG
jgi:hypothetical protein